MKTKKLQSHIQALNTRDHVRWFDKNGKRMYDYLKIEKKLADLKYKRVACDKLWWGGRLSTVWLGLDHSFLPTKNPRPLIFETMLFFRGHSIGQERYSTLEEARKGHVDFMESLTIKEVIKLLWGLMSEELYWKKYEIKSSIEELYEKLKAGSQSTRLGESIWTQHKEGKSD